MTSVTRGEYDVRPFRPDDRRQFLSLYEQVWGRTKSEDWFEWRFEKNPYGDAVEMVVAEYGGELVGAEPLLPFRLRLGDTRLFSYQPVDWMVHPDHRREGVFSRMTDRLIDRYSDRADLLFNFPNGMLLPGLRTFDWRVVSRVPQTYRIQSPVTLLAQRSDADGVPGLSVAATATDPLFDGWFHVRDRLRSTGSDVVVERHESLPLPALVELSAATRPDRLHVARDRAFYEWRFANPNWETTTYLARLNGKPVAALVAATERLDDLTRTLLLDVQPMREQSGGPDAVGTLVGALLADSRDVDVLKAPASLYDRATNGRGFLRDDVLPLSSVASRTTHVVRPLSTNGDLPWDVEGHDLTDPDTWHLTTADQDVE